jgi:DnaJ-domain-containing protein 1
MTACPHCGAELETPLGCGACQVPLEVPTSLDPFRALGLEPSIGLDAEALRTKQLQYSRWIHPDYFAASPELRALAETNTGHLNAALDALEEPMRRADHLVRSLAGPSDDEVKGMSQAFLMEVLDWNESLETAREADAGSPQRQAALNLKPELETQRTEHITAITQLLEPLPEPGSELLTTARLQLNALRYLDRALEQLESLRLADAEAR